MEICYDRIAMAGLDDPDFRVTFDTNIRWNVRNMDLRRKNGGRQILPPGAHLMEVKVANAIPIELSRKMSELGIFPTSISKYGRGYADMMRLREKEVLASEKVVNFTAYKNSIIRKGAAANG